MTRDLSGQRILITGASSGIGRALVEQVAHAGARIALVSRSPDKLNELAAQLGATNRNTRGGRRRDVGSRPPPSARHGSHALGRTRRID